MLADAADERHERGQRRRRLLRDDLVSSFCDDAVLLEENTGVESGDHGAGVVDYCTNWAHSGASSDASSLSPSRCPATRTEAPEHWPQASLKR